MAVSRTLAALMTMITAASLAKDRGSAPQHSVTVCMNPGANAAPVFLAEGVANQILAAADVKITGRATSDIAALPGPAL